MPRRPRLALPGVPLHLIQRGNNCQACFFAEEEYRFYLEWLAEHAGKTGCGVHAYVLMTNHVHLLVTPRNANDISLLFQGVGRHFVPYINKTYQRRGSLWEGRHKGHILDSEDYFLICMRYIEMNPLRAGMVEHPARYRWSSYAANAQGIDNAVIEPHELYMSLGKTSEARQEAYRGLFATAINVDELELIRASLHSGTPLGNDRFKQQIESAVGRSVGFNQRGRPLKQ